LRNRLDPHRSIYQHIDAADRALAVRIGDRPGDVTSDRLHHRSGQTGTARLHDLLRTYAGVIRNGLVVLEGRLSAVASGRLAQHHLRGGAHHSGAILGAGIARLARLEGTSGRCQEIPGMVNRSNR